MAASPGGHDLRLIGPALAVWISAAVSIGLPVTVVYTLAGVAAAGACLLLRKAWSRGGATGTTTWWHRVAADAGPVPAAAGRLRNRVRGRLPAGAVGAHARRAVGTWASGVLRVGRRLGRWSGEPCRSGLSARSARSARRWCARRWGGVFGGRCGRRLGGVLLVCVAASAAGVGLRGTAVGTGPVRELARERVTATAEAVVTADPQYGAGRRVLLVRARMEAVPGAKVRVPVLLIAGDPRWERLVPSQRVRLTGRFGTPERAELLAAVVIVRGPPTVLSPPSTVQRAAERVRARLRAAVADLPPDERGVLPGMVVGDTSRMNPGLADDFKQAGLTHLLVVSGANLAIVVGAVLWLCRVAGLGRRRAPPLAVLAVCAFVVIARPEPSVLRAAVMGLIGLLALFTGRQRQGLPALGAAVVLLVLIDPALARSYGFALSVLATAGLLVLAPPWRERLAHRLPGPVADALAVAAAAQVAVAPVLVMLSGELGVVAVFANLLAAPAVAPATLLGAAGATIALVSVPAARIIVWPAGLAAGWIIRVARTAAGLPYATLPWPGGGLGAVSLLLAGGVAVLILRSARLRLVAAAAMSGVLIAVVALRVLAPGWPPAGWRMVACDVGQGDALALAAGPGRAVVVDAGPDPASVDGCLSRLGVTDVPLLVLTHPHADHIGGTAGVRRGRTVHAVLTTARTSGRERRHTGGLATHPASGGQEWRIGDLVLSVLSPSSAAPVLLPGDDGTTINNASIVLVARAPGFSALLAGDVESDAQRTLASGVPPVDVLKVPHHGSRDQDPGFLEAARATISLISAGADNDYGHPAPSTVALLRRLRTQVHRTDQEGDMAIVRTASGAAVVPRR